MLQIVSLSSTLGTVSVLTPLSVGTTLVVIVTPFSLIPSTILKGAILNNSLYLNEPTVVSLKLTKALAIPFEAKRLLPLGTLTIISTLSS